MTYWLRRLLVSATIGCLHTRKDPLGLLCATGFSFQISVGQSCLKFSVSLKCSNLFYLNRTLQRNKKPLSKRPQATLKNGVTAAAVLSYGL
jgi:hypothetical protein